MAEYAVMPVSVVLVVAVTAATWYLVGDQSTTSESSQPDYFIRPLPIRPAAERAIGLSALLLGVAAGAWLTWASVRHGFDLRWWLVIGPLLASGALIGFAWRVMTAAVIGANIGAGCLILVGGPVVLCLMALAIVSAVYLT